MDVGAMVGFGGIGARFDRKMATNGAF